MKMSKKSNHIPRNTTIIVSGLQAEIFWQTTNCDHFLENYRADSTASTAKSRFYNLRFSQVAKMLSGNVYFGRVPKLENSNKYYALSFYNGLHYFTTFTLEPRPTDPCLLLSSLLTLLMKTVTSTSTKPIVKKSKPSSVDKQGILPGKGPWASHNGKWYTKENGHWVPISAQQSAQD